MVGERELPTSNLRSPVDGFFLKSGIFSKAPKEHGVLFLVLPMRL